MASRHLEAWLMKVELARGPMVLRSRWLPTVDALTHNGFGMASGHRVTSPMMRKQCVTNARDDSRCCCCVSERE